MTALPNDLPGVLGVEAIMARYNLRDPRAARRIIAQAGGRKIAGKWLVRVDDLTRWERIDYETDGTPTLEAATPARLPQLRRDWHETKDRGSR